MTLFGTVAGIAFVLSYAAKLLADAHLSERVALLGSFVGLLPSLNEGISFGIELPWNLHEFLIPVALILLIVVAFRSPRTLCNQLGFGLIAGGALGNVVDRIPDGAVTDFFQVGTFPIFNVADSCITIGVGFLLVEAVLQQWHGARNLQHATHNSQKKP